ncbi:MAG: nicotinate (nicotinamide) nucleotide adenylyltransferase [Eubacteriales bacterium]
MNEQTRRVGVYGGTFAPIHIGHVQAAKAFMEQMKLDYLFIVPAFIPPHKQIDASDDPVHRFRMCELAFEGVDGVIISDIEIKRGGRSYTYDTLRELQSPDTRLFLLCGTDMVLTFDTWYRAEDIFHMCYPTYVRRERDPILDGRIIAKIGEYYKKYGVMFRKIAVDPIELSSTEIREAVKGKKDISGMVTPAVENYIKEHRLYLD